MSRRDDLEAKGIVPSAYDEDYINRQEDTIYQQELVPALPDVDSTLPETVEEARAELDSTLLSIRLSTTSGAIRHGRVLNILQKHPSLATEKFGFYPHRGYPLHLMAGAYPSATVDILEGLYALDRRGIYREGESLRGNHPLICACEVGAKPEILQFFLSKDPELASLRKGTSKHVALHRAVRRFRTSMDSLKDLIDAYPEALALQDENGMTPIDHAFNFSCNPETLQYLLEQCPEQSNQLLIGGSTCALVDIFRADLSILETSLSLAIPQMERVDCRLFYDDECYNHSRSVLRHLQKSTNLRDIRLRLDGDCFFTDPSIVPIVHGLMNHHNSQLRELAISLDFENGRRGPYEIGGGIELCDALWEVAAEKLERLELESFSFQDSGASLAGLLLCTTSPTSTLRELQLNLVRVSTEERVARRREYRSADWKMLGAWRRCRLEKLSLVNCHMDVSRSFLVAFLEETVHMPALKDFELRFDAFPQEYTTEDIDNRHNYDTEPPFDGMWHMDLTEPIFQLLSRGRLEALTIRGPLVRLDRLLPLLTPNYDGPGVVPLRKLRLTEDMCKEPVPLESIKALVQLMAFNDTLTDVLVRDESYRLFSRYIRYTSCLNRYGRSHFAIGSTRATVAKGLEILAHVPKEVQIQDAVFQRHQIVFGVLKHAPLSWCCFL
ncbi:expressed unknown protein [Seminavis robusta]|uniref:Uncharacterized protein n=1 Tax=Seminavis robusta TaxID=568900 RepID=A0A9N8HPJ5_9STRA|nr:expressed unknown protein [Seminavis robusta]|eukprot:Sro1096_g240800.1 n/a (668) ;mRNA; r:21700-23703